MTRSARIELHRRFHGAYMITKSVAIMLLYLTRLSVQYAYNDTDSREKFVRNCCFGDSHDIAEYRCDSFRDSNVTWSAKSNDTFDNLFGTPCCMICVERGFEEEVGLEQSRHEQESSSVAAEPSKNRSCFESCTFSNDGIIRVWEERKRTGNISVDDIAINVGSGDENDDEDDDYYRRDNDTNKNDTRRWHCDSVFTSLNFWGANIVVFANTIYIVPYAIVVIVYFLVPGLGARAYDKAVMCYNITQILLNGILISMGSCILCHVPLHPDVYTFVGLSLMFLTISSTCWLFVICIDMTLTITRFRWASQIDSNHHHREKMKFFTYAGWTLGGSLLPTALACIAELSPILAESSSIRPNFKKFQQRPNLSVILYVTTFPILTCFANTILFCYTSYRMCMIQKSTKLATENSTTYNGTFKVSKARKRYFLFLRLYLLMDAPWITNALAAAFTDLWLLKFLRMIQPILMLLAILPPHTITRVCGCCNRSRNRDRSRDRDCQLREAIPASRIVETP
ncbi:uncharacterized protein LOC116424655 [Nomia melanderi]|uniref:uncharacterized protein LOC116424655 n=1 Tax=Nomia melanderi TaxID=2448451 RepID=UPI00130419A2|nr:uncharacterized protein LOC116424655 [Nomia melanderi]